MSTTYSTNSEAKVISDLLKGSGTIFTQLGKTHEAKVKLILDDQDMSTREKMDALDESDYQLIMKWLAFGACAATVVIMISTGRTIDLGSIGKIGQALAA